MASLSGQVDKLKDKPREDKQAVATGMAGAVVLVLIVIWGFYFLKGLRAEKVQTGEAYFDIPTDTGHVPVTQTYQTYNTSQQNDQFGMPQQ